MRLPANAVQGNHRWTGFAPQPLFNFIVFRGLGTNELGKSHLPLAVCIAGPLLTVAAPRHRQMHEGRCPASACLWNRSRSRTERWHKNSNGPRFDAACGQACYSHTQQKSACGFRNNGRLAATEAVAAEV